MAKSGNWCKNLFYTWVFFFINGLANPIEMLLATVTQWDIVMGWTMDLFYMFASPDSQWENVVKPTTWLIPEPFDGSGSGKPKWSLADVSKTDLEAYRAQFDSVAPYKRNKKYITVPEMEKYIEVDETKSKEEKAKFVKNYIDENGDGNINFEEFVRWMESGK